MRLPICLTEACTGCGACINSCSNGCISLSIDARGFYYPKVDYDKCIKCNKCVHVSPVNMGSTALKVQKYQRVYAAWSYDKKLRYESTSGGVFGEIAKEYLQLGASVCAACYGNDLIVKHKLVYPTEAASLYKLMRSKYVQSDCCETFGEIKELLKKNKVLFCGTPCQVAGLKSFIGGHDDNLLTIDFVCRGVNSIYAFTAWINEIEKENNSLVKEIWFKYKINGWKKSPRCTRIDYKDGSYAIKDGSDNSFMRGYLDSELLIRPSCACCVFKGQNRFSDMTLGDFWKIEEKLDEDLGTSIVIINTDKGLEIFETISGKIYYEKKSIEDVIKGNRYYLNSVKYDKRSKKFFQELKRKNFSTLIQKYCKKDKSIIGMIKGKIFGVE